MICDNSATIFKGHNSLAGTVRGLWIATEGEGRGCTVVSPQAVISWLRSSLAGAKCFESFATSAFVGQGEREKEWNKERQREGEWGRKWESGAASESESWPPIWWPKNSIRSQVTKPCGEQRRRQSSTTKVVLTTSKWPQGGCRMLEGWRGGVESRVSPRALIERVAQATRERSESARILFAANSSPKNSNKETEAEAELEANNCCSLFGCLRL